MIEYILKYRYVDDNPQGLFNIDYTYYNLDLARESAELYKLNAKYPIIITIFKREYKETEIETV